MRDKIEDDLIEKAIIFLIESFSKNRDNDKPVILHSIRVGMKLYDYAYSKDIVIAGILHDLLEDSSSLLVNDIKKIFGNNVINIVKAVTFNKTIKDKNERYKDSFKRSCECGRDSLIVQAVDIVDNSYYYQLAETKEMRMWLVEKMNSFIDISKEKLSSERIIWNELIERYDTVSKFY